jgi:NAD(P)-dependent dehydrogenase (short-subunit alcohol dehydrogenase family)
MAAYDGLRDAVVIVTGAARGLGRALAIAFAAQGSRLVVVDLDTGGLAGTVEACSLPDDRIATEIVDLADIAVCDPLVEEVVARYGRVDVLVNNAAIVSRMPLEASTPAAFERVLRVNLMAPFFLARAAMRAMTAASIGGRIVNVASMAGRTGGVSDVAMYAASKGGLLAATKALAKAGAPAGIRVNAILPSNIESAMLRDAFPPDVVARTLSQVPLGRTAAPQEVAELVLWLASDASSYVTGVNWDINGGWFMS